MRILLINLWDRGGMLHYTIQLSNALAEHFELALVLPESVTRAKLKELRLSASVKVHGVKVLTENPSNPAHVVEQFIEMRKFMRLIDEIQPDLIHLTAAHFWLIFTLRRIAAKYPVVSTVHDAAPHPGLDDTLRKRLEIAALVRYSRHLFVHGEVVAREIRNRWGKEKGDSTSVIAHGDYAFFKDLAQNAALEEPETALFFGRMRAYKGLDVLCEAFRIVRRSLPEAKLLAAGEGPIDPMLRECLQAVGCELHNRYIPELEVGYFFQRASIVVCPYIEASQSGIVPIAYAFEKPVVATRVGGLAEVVEDGKTGLLVSPGEPVQIAEAILTLLNDPEMRREFGEAGFRKMRADLSWGGVSRVTAGIYRRIARQ